MWHDPFDEYHNAVEPQADGDDGTRTPEWITHQGKCGTVIGHNLKCGTVTYTQCGHCESWVCYRCRTRHECTTSEAKRAPDTRISIPHRPDKDMKRWTDGIIQAAKQLTSEMDKAAYVCDREDVE